MISNRPLSRELEESVRLLDAFTRDRFQRFQDQQDHKTVSQNIDGQYDLLRALRGLRENDTARICPQEKHLSDLIAEQQGRSPHPGYLFVPVEQRDLTVGLGGAGGYLVGTEVAPGDVFAGFFHASSVLVKQKISRLTLVGNAGFPKISATIGTYWLPSEGTALTESQFTFAVESGSPKTVGGYTKISDLWLKQTSGVAQAFVLREMARATAAELDKKLLNGAGAAGEPLGLLNVAGVGSVSGTSLAYEGVLDVIQNVENGNGIVQQDRAGFVLAPDAARLLRAREKAAGIGMIMDGYTLADLPAQVTKSIPDGSLIFADWSQLVLCEWGVLEVSVDPFGADGGLFKKGLVGVRTILTVDPVVLHVESFQKVQTIT